MKKIIIFIFLTFLFINVWAVEDATLKNIKVNNKDCVCVEYKCEMEVSESSVSITYELSDPNATTDRESGISTLMSADVMTIKINVTNGESHNVYEFIITKHVKSSDFTLKELYLNEEAIPLMENVFVYNASVKFDEENIIIDAIPNDSKASVDKELVFLFPADESSKSFDFKVTAEDGSQKNYRIFVTRKNRPDTLLKSLKLDNGNINFAKEVLEYNLEVDYTINEILIEAIPNDDNATIKINKESLQVGDNVITIEVTNDNAKSIYTLNVKRSPNLDKSQANLASLSIKEYSKLNFDPNILEYELEFKDIPSSLTIEAYAISDDSVVEVIGNKNLENNSIVTIKVSLSEPSILRMYTLTIKELKEIRENKLPIVITLIILIITIVILIILSVRDSKKNKKTLKRKNKSRNQNSNSQVKKGKNKIDTQKEVIEEIEII